MPIRLSAKDFQQQFGSSLGNQVVNSGMLTSSGITKFGKIKKEEFPGPLKKQKPQIRLPKKREPNKTEAEWMRICEGGNCKVLFEPFALNLPGGVKYTPDVVVVSSEGRIVEIYEVKGGHIHNPGSLLRFKAARAEFPFWKFVFAQKRKDGWTRSDD